MESKKQSNLTMMVIQNELKKIINKKGIVNLDDRRKLKIDLTNPDKQEIKDVVELMIILPTLNRQLPQKNKEEIKQILGQFNEYFDEAYEKIILSQKEENVNKKDYSVAQSTSANMQNIQGKANTFNDFIQENSDKLPREYLSKTGQIKHIPIYKGRFNEIAPKNQDLER